MSRAFVKEADGEDFSESLPDRPVSDLPNYVTARGLRLIDEEMGRLKKDLATAQAAGERAALARHSRDLRYWTARRATAQVVPPPDDGRAGFGTAITIEWEHGRRKTYRIVGEDEAEPAQGRISWVSPMAKALSGKSAGDLADAPNGEVEIVAIDHAPEPD